jgi:hypothetical protein
MTRLMDLSRWSALNVIGLILAAAGMLVQMAAGSTLYPTVTGPLVLVATAALVVFGPLRWTRWIGLSVPLVLGIGAAVAATMTGTFVEQLTGRDAGLLLGSWMHSIGLAAAVAGGVAVVVQPREAATVGR